MKKLIVFLVAFALLAGSVFAVDLGGEVFGTFYLLNGDTSDASDYVFSGNAGDDMGRVRLQGAGGSDTYGGWLRAEAGGFWGNAWWKPIDQLLIRLGSNGGDGFWGKDGVTRWGFHQRAGDVDIGTAGNAWGGGYINYGGFPITFSNAFYGGIGNNHLGIEIKPMDMLEINLGVPFKSGDQTLGDVFASTTAQIAVNLDFGTIAVTYLGAPIDDVEGGAEGDPYLYAYFGLTAIENISIDVGLGVNFAEDSPLYAGLGAQVTISDAFGLKARAMGGFAGGDKNLGILFDIMPYFAVSDSVKVFCDIGLDMTVFDNSDLDTRIGWHVNPYLWVGEQWGPAFWAGVKIWSTGTSNPGDDAVINFSIPIAVGLSF
jgi:hypothetical protein